MNWTILRSSINALIYDRSPNGQINFSFPKKAQNVFEANMFLIPHAPFTKIFIQIWQFLTFTGVWERSEKENSFFVWLVVDENV